MFNINIKLFFPSLYGFWMGLCIVDLVSMVKGKTKAA